MRYAILLLALGACVDDPAIAGDLPTTDLDLSAASDGGSDLSVTLDLPSGDLWVPYDGGITPPVFTEANDGLDGGAIVAIAFASGAHLYLCTPNDVYESLDGGATWARIAATPSLRQDESLTSIAAATGKSFIGTKVVVGTSQGRVLELLGTAFEDRTPVIDLGLPFSGAILDVVILSTGVLLAISPYELLASDPASAPGLWTPYTTGTLPTGLNRRLHLDERTNQSVFLVRSGGISSSPLPGPSFSQLQNASTLYSSFGGGATKTRVAVSDGTTVPFTVDEAGTKETCPALPSLALSVGVTPLGTILARSDNGLDYIAGCASGTWNHIDAEPSSEVAIFRAHSSVGTALFGLSPKGLFTVSVSPAAAPQPRDNLLHAQSITAIAAGSDSADNLWVASNRGLYRRRKSGLGFQAIMLDPAIAYPNVRLVAAHSDGMHLVALTDGVYTSDDNGSSWQWGSRPLDTVLFDEANGRMVGCDATGLVTAPLGGTSWAPLSTDLGVGPSGCTLLVRHPSGVLFAAGYSSQQIFRSGDGGTTWTSMAPGQILQPIMNLAIDPQDDTSVLATLYAMGVLRVEATSTKPVLTDGEIEGITVDPVNPKIYYAATRTSVRFSDNRGATWTAADGSLAGAHPRAVFVHPADRRHRWLATANRGIYFSLGELQP